jgi:heat shock protein HslJ
MRYFRFGRPGNRTPAPAVQRGMRARIAITLLLLVVSAGCGRGTGTQAGSTGNGAGDPWGRTFQPKPLVEGTRITLRFDRERRHLGASAGCNSMGGPASFEGGKLVVDDLATTEMGCDPPRHAQDEWVADFLTSRPTWALDGPVLTLETGTARMVLEDRETADPDRPLRNTNWTVDTIIEGESASSVPAGAEAHLTLGDGDDRDRFAGHAGCNGMGGTSVVDEKASTITFSEVITTKMACEDDRMRLERAVLATLDGPVTYRIDADRLHLDGPGGHGLILRAG